MRREITPQEAGRQFAYDCWINNTMPMVTLVSTLDVTHVVRVSKKRHLKFNMLMCYCILKAAKPIREMYSFLSGKQMVTSDKLTIQTIINMKQGGLGFCDMPFCDSLDEFNRHYLRNTSTVLETNEHFCLNDGSPIYTSCVPNMYVDAAVNQYCDKFAHPFLAWGRYRKSFPWRYRLPISFQFHHVQMDGRAVGDFFNNLQKEFDTL